MSESVGDLIGAIIISIVLFALIGLIAVTYLGMPREPATIAPGASTPIGSSWSAPPRGEGEENE